MTDEVQCDSENFSNIRPQQDNGPSKIVGLVIKLGLADSEEKANYVLLIITIVVFIASILIFFINNKGSKSGPPVNQETIQQMMLVNMRSK
jgi:uncharacterized protein YneF (UPF0154 family)